MADHVINQTTINETLTYFGLTKRQEWLSVFLVFIMCIILFGNGIIIYAIIRFHRLRTPTNQFVVALALADIIMALSLPYQIVFYLCPSLYTVKQACLMRYITFLLPCGTSLTHVLAITVDRYLSIMQPLRYITLMTNQRVFLISGVLWTYSLILGLVPLYWNDWNRTQTCIFTKVLTPGYIILLLIHFLLIGLLMLTLYVRIFSVTRKLLKGPPIQSACLFNYDANCRYRKKNRSLLLYGVIVGFFCFLWLPFFIVILIQMLWFNNSEIFQAGRIATLIGLISSIINPVIYVALNKPFRKTIKQMFRSLASKISRPCFLETSRKSFYSIGKTCTPPT